MAYNWQHPEWPRFVYNIEDLQSLILELAHETGEVSGMVMGLSEELRQKTQLQLMM